MMEILAGELENAITNLKINAKKTYQCTTKNNEYQEEYQVWEMSQDEFDKLCSINEKDWHDDWGWWRHSNGSVMRGELHRYNINGHYMTAWDDRDREKYDWKDRKYKNLLEYFHDELNLSTEKNITALSVDLASINNMKMSELWQKYMG